MTGTLVSSRSLTQKIDIRDGTFKDGELSFALRRMATHGSNFATWYKGKVKGDTMSGKIEVEMDGVVQRIFDWEAMRSPE